jgi:hypothetical protein
MSNLVFPSITANPKTFAVGWPIKKTPSYLTIVQTPASRRGQTRISLTPNPIWRWELDLTMLRGDLNQASSAVETLLAFYQRMQGAAEDWLFQDPYDNAAAGELLATGDGVTTQFQLRRSLQTLGAEMMQTVFPTAIKIDGATVPAGPQASGNQWYCGLENLLLYSQDFSNTSAWGIIANATITPNTIVAPDGTTTADDVSFSATGTGSYVGQPNLTPPYAIAGETFTFSVWLKTASGTHSLTLNVEDQLGVVIAISAFQVTTSWQRFSITGTFNNATTGFKVFIYNPDAVTHYHYWGAQLERWTSATSYVATTSVAPVIPRGLATLAIAPALGTQVTADFSYYYRCRFLEDDLADLEEFLYQYWALSSLKFESVIL